MNVVIEINTIYVTQVAVKRKCEVEFFAQWIY